MEEKQLRTIVCPDHNLRYDPTQTDGCVRCMRLLGTGGVGRPATQAGTVKAPPKPGSKLIPAIVLAATLFAGFLLTRTVHEKAPKDAFVDPEGRFALIVPPRWKTVDPSTVTYLPEAFTDEETVATLISDRGKLAPTITIDVTDGSPGPASAGDIPEFEEGVREGWGDEGKLDMKTRIATVDRIRSFNSSMIAELRRQKITMEHYLIPGRTKSYLITAILLGDKPDEVSAAAKAMADGFRVLERPPLLGRLPLRIALGLLFLALIGSIRALAKG